MDYVCDDFAGFAHCYGEGILVDRVLAPAQPHHKLAAGLKRRSSLFDLAKFLLRFLELLRVAEIRCLNQIKFRMDLSQVGLDLRYRLLQRLRAVKRLQEFRIIVGAQLLDSFFGLLDLFLTRRDDLLHV